MTPLEGSWSLSDKKILLQVEKFSGRSLSDIKKENAGRAAVAALDKPLELAVGDGSSLTMQPLQGSGLNEPIVLTREAKGK
jgi:hypothetical protein